MNQTHLSFSDTINLGSFYTSQKYVDVVWNMIKPHLSKKMVVLDSSCGYGNFFKSDVKNIQIGVDVDKQAIEKAKKLFPEFVFFSENALGSVSRKKIGIREDDKLCVVGNPPYNDTTSIIRSGLKKEVNIVDEDIKTRDLGMSFLLSFDKLKADVVCVLHPLSYLIKKTNFNSISKFIKNYKLVDNLIIDSSTSFGGTSKVMGFPIIIGLYLRDEKGMSYDDILNTEFKVENGKRFRVSDFQSISKYINKYPNKYKKPEKDDILFYTMRDINALRRTKTFLSTYSDNAIIVDKSKLSYYIYVDIFKEMSKKVPYYLGNCDVFLDDVLFQKYKAAFVFKGLQKYPEIKDQIQFDVSSIKLNIDQANYKIEEYFKHLLKEHYAN